MKYLKIVSGSYVTQGGKFLYSWAKRNNSREDESTEQNREYFVKR